VATDWIEDKEDWDNMGDVSHVCRTEIRERLLGQRPDDGTRRAIDAEAR
jgi:hypothetical protein